MQLKCRFKHSSLTNIYSEPKRSKRMMAIFMKYSFSVFFAARDIARASLIMRIGLFLCFISVIIPDQAMARNQLQIDLEDLSAVFKNAADITGPSLIKCGNLQLLQEMKDEVKFIEAAYHRLHKNFPQANPPIEDQIAHRNKIVCEIIRCNEKPDDDSCSRYVDKEGRPNDMWLIDYRLREVKTRLIKSKIDPERIGTTKNSGHY